MDEFVINSEEDLADIDIDFEEHQSEFTIDSEEIVSGVTSGDYLVNASMNMSSGRLAVIRNGLAEYFDANDVEMYGLLTGVTKTSVLAGDAVSIRLNGIFYEAGLGLTPNKPYYAGLNGALVLNPTGLKLVQPIGNSINGNTLNININSPIITL